MEVTLLLCILLLFVFVYHLYKHYIIPKIRHHPPLVTGLFPFIGAAIEFGKGPPVEFIKSCQEKYGDIFTLHLAGRYMTFLMNEEDFPVFFSENEEVIDFQYATQPFLSRCFGVPKESYFESHKKVLNTVRANLTPKNLNLYLQQFSKNIQINTQKVPNWPQQSKNGEGESSFSKVMLMSAFRRIIFSAALKCVYGNDFNFDEEIEKAFTEFDSGFELASSNIPHLFQPKFVNAKSKLLKCTSSILSSYLQKSKRNQEMFGNNNNNNNNGNNNGVKDNANNDNNHRHLESKQLSAENTLGQIMVTELGAEGASNWLLAIMWATEANSIPSLFWLFHYLILHPKYLSQTRQQILDVLKGREVEEIEDISELNGKFDLLRNAIQETFRLHSPPLIVRGVRSAFRLHGFTLERGNFLCLSPFWAHRNDRLYSNANEWDPSRWSRSDSPHDSVRFSYLAFGYGVYRCPGQSFAYMMMLLISVHIISKFDFQFDDSSSAFERFATIDKMNLVGITKPVRDIPILLKYRL